MSKFWDDTPGQLIALSAIEAAADKQRKRSGLKPEDRIVLDTLFSKLDIKVTPTSLKRMAGAIALASPNRDKMEIYVTAAFRRALRTQESDDDRLIALHEVGHLTWHSDAQTLRPRMVGGNLQAKFIRPEESRELQADQHARALALPRDFPWWNHDDKLIAGVVGIPAEHVAIRRAEIQARKPDFPVVTTLALQAAEKVNLWKRLPAIEDEDASKYRNCKGYRICWEDFDKRYPPHQMGWYILRGEIRPAMGE